MRRSILAVTTCRLIMLCGAAISLAACANPFDDHAPTLSDILDGGWLGLGDASTSATAATPVYCYGTIGREDCYDAPLPAEEGRLVGYEGPPPPARDDL